MISTFARVLAINHTDEDTRRRGRNVLIISGGQLLLILLSVPNVLANEQSRPILPVLGVIAVLLIVATALARQGQVTLAALLLVVVCAGGIAVIPLATKQVSTTPYFFLVSLLVAGATIRARAVGVVLLIDLALIGFIFLPIANMPQPLPDVYSVIRTAVILCIFTALIGALSAATMSRALSDAHQARTKAEEAAAALDKANAALELQVSERTAALQQALVEVETRMAEQERLLAENEQQRLVIRELSVPVLPVSNRTLVMPLVGALDTQRLHDVQEQALSSIERSSARYLLLDITGVPVVDTLVAKGIVSLVRAAKLLGTDVALVGIRPEVAQTIVGLGLDLRSIPAFADLQVALDNLDR